MKKLSIKYLLLTISPAIAILTAIAIVSVLYQVPVTSLTRDISAIANIHPFSGFLSNLGILLWCIAGSTCAFTAMILRSKGSRVDYLFFLFSALLSAYLMLDDLFLFHELLANRFFGLSEELVYVLLLIAVLTYLVYFRKAILRTNAIVLFVALVFLSLSITIDAISKIWLNHLGDWEYFFEDGAKWLGIVFWCSYYVQSSFQSVEKITKKSNNAE